MLRSVGVEPTGERFNSTLLDAAHNRAFNPMVNSGTIVPASLLTCASAEHGAEEMRALFSRLAGRRLEIDEAVFRSEHETGHRNRAIAWLMLNSGMIEPDPDRVLALDFRQCSVLVNCADLASMACTLETLGRQPLTGAQGFAAGVTWDVLSVKTTCGIYDYAGQWLYDVGLPAKSAVSGLIMAVVPGQRGLAVYSPQLDRVGNSVRGIEVCRGFARDFGLHACTSVLDAYSALRRFCGAREVACAPGPSMKYRRPLLGQRCGERAGRLPRLRNRSNPGDRRRMPATTIVFADIVGVTPARHGSTRASCCGEPRSSSLPAIFRRCTGLRRQRPSAMPR